MATRFQVALFGKQFFKSSDGKAETSYKEGVNALSRGEYLKAYHLFNEAAKSGHASAYYNLFLIHGGGYITPFDPDAAADNFYKAAAANHPKAKEQLFMLEGADRAGYGMDNLARTAAASEQTGYLPPIFMVCGCRFVDSVSKKFGATMDVVAYELDAASMSDKKFVRSFITRTGVAPSVYRGGMGRLIEGSAADQITDGLNQMSIALMGSNMNNDLALMARCTMVGYMIKKSHLGIKASQLMGVQEFLAA